MKITDIKDIEKFTIDQNAWYHVRVPDWFTEKDLNNMMNVLDNLNIEGKFLLTNDNFKITDITEYIECQQ